MKKKIASGIRHPQAPERALRQSDIPFLFLLNAEHALARHHLPRIAECLGRLSEKDIWWRPNPASNSGESDVASCRQRAPVDYRRAGWRAGHSEPRPGVSGAGAHSSPGSFGAAEKRGEDGLLRSQ